MVAGVELGLSQITRITSGIFGKAGRAPLGNIESGATKKAIEAISKLFTTKSATPGGLGTQIRGSLRNIKVPQVGKITGKQIAGTAIGLGIPTGIGLIGFTNEGQQLQTNIGQGAADFGSSISKFVTQNSLLIAGGLIVIGLLAIRK